MSDDERYEDCERCQERYTGKEFIARYLIEVEVPGGAIMVCFGCLPAMRRSQRPNPKFDIGDRIVYQSCARFKPQVGQVTSRRWEYGNRTWGYVVHLDVGHPMGCIEEWLRQEVE